jgi:hypothetical protein
VVFYSEKVITDNVEIYELLEQHENEGDLFDSLVKMVSTQPEPEEAQPKSEDVALAIANVEQE